MAKLRGILRSNVGRTTMQLSRRSTIAGLGALAACSPKPKAEPKAKAAAPEGRTAVPGGSIWWTKLGGGAKTPLLTLHGGPGAGHNYLKPLGALADERPLILYDQL